jgi:hypothetical protein
LSKTARSGAAAVFDVISNVVGDLVVEVAVEAVSAAVSNVDSESLVVSSKSVGSGGVVAGAVAELVAALPELASESAPELPADFEFGCGELRLALELAARAGATVWLDLKLMLVSGFATKRAPDFTSEFPAVLSSVFAPGFSSNIAEEWESYVAVVSAAAAPFSECSD